jgi:hypothetical protein
VNQRPPSFTVTYHGEPLEFTQINTGSLKGYGYKCPGIAKHASRAYNWIDTETGDRHHLEFDEEGRATIRGSLLCGQGCGWHVIVEHGVARDT